MKQYEAPSLEVIVFRTADVIFESPNYQGGGNGNDNEIEW